MAKKRAARKKAAVVAKAMIEPIPEIEHKYTVGKWCGLPNYECKFCAYATLDKKRMINHVVKNKCRNEGTVI